MSETVTPITSATASRSGWRSLPTRPRLPLPVRPPDGRLLLRANTGTLLTGVESTPLATSQEPEVAGLTDPKKAFAKFPKMSLDRPLADLHVDETEELTDPRAMRALAHPLRLALIELLSREGTINATEAAAELSESQASCSFHLRQLAKFGLVVEVEGVRGRARPWRLSRRGLRVSNVQDDPEAEIAWAALERLLRDRQLGRYREWLEGRSAHSRVWREAAYHSQGVAWLTPEELESVADRITAETLDLFPERREDAAARPAGALPVELLSMGYPIAPPEE